MIDETDRCRLECSAEDAPMQNVKLKIDGKAIAVPLARVAKHFEPLSLEDVASELGLSARHVRYLCENGKFGRKMGTKHWVIFRWELRAYKKLPKSRPGPKPKVKA